MATKTTAWFIGGAIALAGCATGFLLGFWAGTANTIEQMAHDDSTDARDLAPALADLQRDSGEILRRLGDGRSKSASADAARAASDERLAHLTSAVDALATRIDAERELRKGPGFPAIGLVRTDADLRAAHAFWTRDDVSQRYGEPALLRSTLHANGAMDHFCYPVGSSPPAWLDFVVSEDQVIDVLVSDDGLPPH